MMAQTVAELPARAVPEADWVRYSPLGELAGLQIARKWNPAYMDWMATKLVMAAEVESRWMAALKMDRKAQVVASELATGLQG